MENKFILTALSSALVVGMSLAAGNAVAEGLPVTLNGTACGNYTDVSFDKSGNLKLTANLSCLISDNDTGITPPPDKDPGLPGTGIQPPVFDPEVPTACGPAPANMITNHNNPWDQMIPTDVRKPISLKPAQVYSLKINKPAGKNGYGVFNTINLVGASGMRTIVVSECPGSMTPVGKASAAGYNPCKAIGTEEKITWTFDGKTPRGITQCRLDKNKQYYINVKHLDGNGQNSCTTSQCTYSYGYELVTKLK